MKPILPYSILLSIAISPLALATDYNVQILNYNGIVPNDGVVKVTASTAGNTTGAVHINSASSTTTNLSGYVSITNNGAGGNAIYVGGSGANTLNITGDGIEGQHVTLRSLASGDGCAVVAKTASSTVNINANGQNIICNKGDGSGSTNGTGTAMIADAGAQINLIAKTVEINYSAYSNMGLVTVGGNSRINVTGDVKAASYQYALLTRGGAISVSGDVTTSTSTGYAIATEGTSTDAIYIGGHTTVNGGANVGVYAKGGGTITLKGGLTSTSSGVATAIYSTGAGSIVKDNATAGTGTNYNVKGKIQTVSNGTIDLHMGAGSTFTGYTTNAGTT